MQNKVVIFGFDNMNSVGLIHSFNKSDFYVIGLLWGKKTGLVGASKYVSEILTAPSPANCIQRLLSKYPNTSELIVIIPSCDEAAVVLEDSKPLIPHHFHFQCTRGKYTIRDLQYKSLQVELARQAGFHVPLSWQLGPNGEIPESITYPCIIKPLASYTGSKNDLQVCYNLEDLENNLKNVIAPQIILQQYIEKDNDYIVIGCGLKDGTVYLPYCNKKLSIFPEKVGLASVVKVISPPTDIVKATESLIKAISYNGVFSVEFMYCQATGKYYFIECNLRNDGCNDFILKSGCNVPKVYYYDLVDTLNKEELNTTCKHKRFVWEMHHYQAFMNNDISFVQWIRDIIQCDGFLSYLPNDKWPFFKQFVDMLKIKLRIYKHELY